MILSLFLCNVVYAQGSRQYQTSYMSVPVKSFRLSNNAKGDNIFYPSEYVNAGIMLTSTNNLVDKTGEWEFYRIGIKKGIEYCQEQKPSDGWVSSVGVEEECAYFARARSDYDGWMKTIVIYCNYYITKADEYQGIIGANITYCAYNDIHHMAVSPEIFEEGYKVYDPILANLFIDVADTNYDGMISYQERCAITELWLFDMEYMNLTDGNLCLEYFPNLKSLDIGTTYQGTKTYQGVRKYTSDSRAKGIISENLIVKNPRLEFIILGDQSNIKHVNLSKCPNLKDVRMFDCSSLDIVLPHNVDTICTTGNVFEYLDFSNCNLKHVQINNSQCKRIVVPKTATNVVCKQNKLQTIDLSSCSEVKYLDLADNYLVNIDVSDCNKLEKLYLENNRLQNLDLSSCLNLRDLRCDSNPLKSLNVSQNSSILKLSCYNCDFTELDLSSNKKLRALRISSNSYSNKLKTIYLPQENKNDKYYIYDWTDVLDFAGIDVKYR